MQDVHQFVEDRANGETGKKFGKMVRVDSSIAKGSTLRSFHRVVPQEVIQRGPWDSGQNLTIHRVMDFPDAGSVHRHYIRHIFEAVR
jgi:hypothetical protein